MKTITISALAALLANTSSVQEVQFLSVTNARARKNPFGTVYKESRVTGSIGNEYGFAVNTALVAGGARPTFKPAPRKWGQRVGGALVVNGNDYHMAVNVISSPFPRFLLSDGNPVAKEVIQRFLPAKYFSARQAEKGLEPKAQVKHVTYALKNIREISIAGQSYKVRG